LRNLLRLSYTFIFLVITGCATTPPIIGSASAVNGQERIIHNFGFWRSDCSAAYFHIRILEEPEHGHLEIRKSTMTIPKTADVGTARALCSGREIQSKQLVYIADEGYKGSDKVIVSIRAPDSKNSQPYETTVVVR